VVVEQMPLTPSGKLDRRALAGLAGTRLRVQGVAQPPRNELEAGLVAVWEQVLGRRPVGVQDDFFELGGHSLLAMGLMRAVAQRFGRDLPLASLFAAPTIEQFARLLAAPEAATQLPITGGLRGAGQGPPLFHVPGIAGYEFLPAAVARRVGAVGRFYDGLEYPGLGGQEAPLDRVEDIAAHLVGQIRRVWPVGPVCLSGHSFGGVVAYEVARQLHSQGAHVEQVLLWDSFAPGAFRKRTSGETLRVLRAHLATLEPLARLGFLARRTIGKVEFLRAGLRKRLHTPGLASAPLVASGWVDDPEGPKARVMAAALRAYHAYRPSPYAGKLVLFQVQDRAFGLGLRFAPDPFNGWKSCARGRLEVVPVPGEHNSVLQEPAVGVLAEKTLAALRPKAAPSA
jgi:thioesterase domain-containing protein/aryl carrier-like protein